MDNLLSIIIFVPLIAALILALFLRGDDPAANKNAKWLALIATSVSFLLSIGLIVPFVLATGCVVIAAASQFHGNTQDVMSMLAPLMKLDSSDAR